MSNSFNIFGFEIRKKPEQKTPSVVSPVADDGATIVSGNSAGYYGVSFDMDNVVRNENDLIRRYRDTAQYPDCDSAIEDIVNEAIVSDSFDDPVSVMLDGATISPAIKKKILDEFRHILGMFKFRERGHDIFRQWYIDGRICFHMIVDPNNPKAGISEIRLVDPRKIRKVKNIIKKKLDNGVEVVDKIEEFYVYNDKGIDEASNSSINNQGVQGVRLTDDSIIYVTSGLFDTATNVAISHLHKCIKPVNQLKMMEDALVIYRISRAPERRIFYIDVGGLPKQRAEQYVNELMNKFRNKVVYDASTGEVKDSRNHMSMMEDFWLPRRENGKGTEITTLPGGQSLGEVADVDYFQNKLYKSLNVPISRLSSQTGFNLGRTTEITRDEVKFNKFIERLRKRFAQVFHEALRTQLVSKNVIRIEEWDSIAEQLVYDYRKDNHFAELKDGEVVMQRISMLSNIDPYVGKYYSVSWVRKNILKQTDEEIQEIDQQNLELAAQPDDQEETE